MKKILVFSLYCKEGASSNFRILMYVNDFKKKYDVDVYSFWNKKYVEIFMINKSKYRVKIFCQFLFNTIKRIIKLVFFAPKYDIIIIQKSIIPKIPLFFLNYLKKQKCAIIFDVDDAVYLEKRDYSTLIASASDVVIVGNKSLENEYLKYNNNVFIFPTVDYSPMYKEYISDTYANKCIGWIGSKSTLSNLEIIVPAINEVIERHPEVRFKYIANEAAEYEHKIKNSRFVKWSSETYIQEMSEFTIGIMPLFDTPYNRGKCGFKLVQYLNLNKPVIASDVGVNCSIVGHCGLIVDTQTSWGEALENLLFNEHFYNECLKNISNEFQKKYSYEIVLEKWINLLEKIGNVRGKND